jgi:hypothetical protein
VSAFLDDLPSRGLRSLVLPPHLHPTKLLIGQGESALEVAVIDGDRLPTNREIREAWKGRTGRAAPVIVVALAGDEARLCFGAASEPALYDTSRRQAENLCRAALAARAPSHPDYSLPL